eukprot:UN0930
MFNFLLALGLVFVSAPSFKLFLTDREGFRSRCFSSLALNWWCVCCASFLNLGVAAGLPFKDARVAMASLAYSLINTALLAGSILIFLSVVRVPDAVVPTVSHNQHLGAPVLKSFLPSSLVGELLLFVATHWLHGSLDNTTLLSQENWFYVMFVTTSSILAAWTSHCTRFRDAVLRWRAQQLLTVFVIWVIVVCFYCGGGAFFPRALVEYHLVVVIGERICLIRQLWLMVWFASREGP